MPAPRALRTCTVAPAIAAPDVSTTVPLTIPVASACALTVRAEQKNNNKSTSWNHANRPPWVAAPFSVGVGLYLATDSRSIASGADDLPDGRVAARFQPGGEPARLLPAQRKSPLRDDVAGIGGIVRSLILRATLPVVSESEYPSRQPPRRLRSAGAWILQLAGYAPRLPSGRADTPARSF